MDTSKSLGCLAFLPKEVFQLVVDSFDVAKTSAVFACTSSAFKAEFTDARGRLCTRVFSTTRLASAVEGLTRVSPSHLETIRVDLAGELRQALCPEQVSALVLRLGDCLTHAVSLRELVIRLSSFDARLERLRLNHDVWAVLIRGLAFIARHQTIRSLELSFITLKQLTELPFSNTGQDDGDLTCRAVDSPARSGHVLRRCQSSPTRGACAAVAQRPRTLLTVLGDLTSLEELTLTHNEIQSKAAKELASACGGLQHLRRLDLTRNHIPPSTMQEVCDAIPRQVKISGADKQTFCW